MKPIFLQKKQTSCFSASKTTSFFRRCQSSTISNSHLQSIGQIALCTGFPWGWCIRLRFFRLLQGSARLSHTKAACWHWQGLWVTPWKMTAPEPLKITFFQGKLIWTNRTSILGGYNFTLGDFFQDTGFLILSFLLQFGVEGGAENLYIRTLWEWKCRDTWGGVPKNNLAIHKFYPPWN